MNKKRTQQRGFTLKRRVGLVPKTITELAFQTKNGLAQNSKAGFTLVEVMIAVLILTIALSGLLYAFSACLILNENSRNISLALNGAQDVIEQIRNDNFNNIITVYDGVPFQLGSNWFLANNDHIGIVQVISDGSDDAGITNANLLQVRVVICWRQQGGRIIGEAIDVAGALVTNDLDGDGKIESPAELITLISGP